MEDKFKNTISSHRKINEIGGILLGVGLGLFIAKAIDSNSLLDVIKLLSALLGFAILVFEQRKWNKLKNK